MSTRVHNAVERESNLHPEGKHESAHAFTSSEHHGLSPCLLTDARGRAARGDRGGLTKSGKSGGPRCRRCKCPGFGKHVVAQTYPDSAPFLPEAWVLNASNKIVEESLLISPGLAPVSRDSDQTIVFHDCRSVVVNMHQTTGLMLLTIPHSPLCCMS